MVIQIKMVQGGYVLANEKSKKILANELVPFGMSINDFHNYRLPEIKENSYVNGDLAETIAKEFEADFFEVRGHRLQLYVKNKTE